MKAEYFIGIVPPEEYLTRVVQLQSKWISQLGVEPHITLKAQGGLTPDKKWINKVKRVCENFKPFQVSLGKPSYFGDNILYLSVNSNKLHQLHQKIVQEISPSGELIKQYFELDAFVPHLTLGKEQYGGNISPGLSTKELQEMERAAGIELSPYPEFEVDFIRVYQLNNEKQRYEKYLDVTLGN
ncbi:2'-5' RNA ligase family protein [Bacillus sp. ISL-41]|uniref:2'-5' RNA ligase family protein n=1 Tax=Bacillus sp. ISL-41 TaxID=2819127 RepID=UPI001BEA5752|nr:2'-5' RNA ligase family protein [Bacillus sp. ISL-41]MBT2641930.1 2'-5' RNA ligase family protein [Bacillus sp. ISL-41]